MTSLPTSGRTGVRRVAPTMGTMASIVVHDDAPTDVVDTAIGAVLAELERLEAIFSTTGPTASSAPSTEASATRSTGRPRWWTSSTRAPGWSR